MLIYILTFCIGSCFGSFLMVVSERLPLGKSFIRPPSHCQHCQQVLMVRDLIPIASYLCLKGCCRYCQRSYPMIFFVAEIGSGLLFCLLTLAKLWHLSFLPGLLLLSTALLLSLTDILYLVVEPLIFYPMTLLTLLSILWLSTNFSLHLVDGFLVWVTLRIITNLFPKQLGYGDVLLLTSWALFLGGYALNLIILFGSLLALLFVLIRGQQRTKPVPFVPFLSAAMIGYLFWQASALIIPLR